VNGANGRDTVCEVCGAEVSRADAILSKRRGHVVCRNGACQGLIAQQTTMDPTVYRAHFELQSRLIRQRRERDAWWEERAAAVEMSDAEDNRRILEAVRREIQPDGHLVVLAIPSGLANVVPMPEERRERYREHLEAAIEEAVTFPDTDTMPENRDSAARTRSLESEAFLRERPTLTGRTDHICGMCKGGCCTTGREHAFISPFTVRRMLDADPALTPEEVLDTYLDHVPTHSIEGACINQTATGCALPRAWRSDVCNGYFCPPLNAYQEGWDESTEHDPVLVIRRNYHVWNRILSASRAVREVAVLDEEGVHPVAVDSK
jgi:hypothetical protein